MKKYLVILCLLISFLTSFCVTQAKETTESIESFDANIKIQKNGSLSVTENITYNFNSNERHGIFRTIPLTVRGGPHLVIDVHNIIDDSGATYNYRASINNDVLKIKIGDPDILISGTKNYIINYEVHNAIRVFDEHDELYWNVTGTKWDVPIQDVKASVVLPYPSIVDVQMDCFTGLRGSTQKNCMFNQTDGAITYSVTQPLTQNEGLTFVIGIPPGHIENVYVESSESDAMVSYLSSLFFMIFLWITIIIIAKRTKITKPKPVIPKEIKSEPIVVAYHPPDQLLPIDVGTLLDSRVDITDLASVIMDLAVRRYLKIRYTLKKRKFWLDKKDFMLEKLKSGNDLIHPADKIIFNLLFNKNNSISLSDLKKQRRKFQSDVEKVKKRTKKKLYDDLYFSKSATKTLKSKRARFLIIIAVLFLISFISSFISRELGDLLMLVALLMVVIFFIKSIGPENKLTEKGCRALRGILGFREFLQLTEKHKLEQLNDPDLNPEIFEKFLPYAMVLGVEDKWAEKFKDIYHVSPSWYEDPYATNFSSYDLTKNLSLFNTSFNRAFNIASSSSSSGFSGGSSGGGSGGGGGGSW